MSTRAVIARKTSAGFAGVYHHWDGHPHSLGKTLFELRNTFFKGDTEAMLDFLINQHGAGWSTINDCDFSRTPGMNEAGFETTGPHCYCHGGRHEKPNRPGSWTHCNAADCGCEYAYAFDGNGTMTVLTSIDRDGDKMIGIAGFGDPKSQWLEVAVIDLGGVAPDWDAISEAARKGKAVDTIMARKPTHSKTMEAKPDEIRKTASGRQRPAAAA